MASVFVVARGHPDLFEQLLGLFWDFEWLQLIEDRRQDRRLLPREDRLPAETAISV